MKFFEFKDPIVRKGLITEPKVVIDLYSGTISYIPIHFDMYFFTEKLTVLFL